MKKKILLFEPSDHLRKALFDQISSVQSYEIFDASRPKDIILQNKSSTFDLIAHGDCTDNKRPSPEIYEWILEKLRLPSQSCIAIEDSLRGVESARNANIEVLVTPSSYTKHESFKDAKVVVSDLGEKDRPFKKIKGNVFDHKFVDFKLLSRIIKG